MKHYFPFGFRAASIAASVGDGKKKEQRFVIWPEWSDADINAEKWVRTFYFICERMRNLIENCFVS